MAIKPLLTEPSLVEPEPPRIGYNVVYDSSLMRGGPRVANDYPFETKGEAIDFALEFFGATIEAVKPVSIQERKAMNDI